MFSGEKKKKIIAIIIMINLFLQIFLSILQVQVFAVETTEEITRNYEIKAEETWDISLNNDESVIAKWTRKDRTIVISGTGEMKNWNYSSKESWHNTHYADIVEKIVIEEGVTNIGKYAFAKCDGLKSVIIPESVTKIKANAFYDSRNLVDVVLPEKITSLEDGIFQRCEALKQIKIPESVTTIGKNTFSECTNLESIIIPEKVTIIDDSAFYSCSKLTKIEIPESVTSLGNFPFSKCSNLEGIKVNENNKNYMDIDGILFNKEGTKLVKYPPNKMDINTYTIRNEVTNINTYAFYECNGLSSTIVPEGVSTIEGNTFYKCTNLESIVIPEQVTNINMNGIESSTIIYAKPDSEAHKCAEESKIAYILDGEATNTSTSYEIKNEMTWDISVNKDNSIISKWTRDNRTLTISGIGEMKD